MARNRPKVRNPKTKKPTKILIWLYLGMLLCIAMFFRYFGTYIASALLLLSILALYYYVELRLSIKTIAFHILLYVLIVFVFVYLFGIRE